MTQIDHIGIAVKSIEEAARLYTEGLALSLEKTETVEAQGVRVGFLPLGESEIELLEPLSDDGPVAKFLQSRGEGIHHICIRVSDIRAAMAALRQAGARLLSEEPQPGAGGCLVVFVHPRSANGVLLELSQAPGDAVGDAEA
ncbi:MAG: methylmalonyl-CoA epimerase [Chloroflexi bacterium]|nr:methylmalonyl-CoA epimerase [Chloroflexota bacterium]